VLVGADLEVPRGSVVALLGPSGCGKTTLVRLVAGFERPDAGTIALSGRVVASAGGTSTDGPRGGGGPGTREPEAHVGPEHRRVGVVPQEGALFSHVDVAGNVGFGLPRRGRTAEGRARVGHMLSLVGLAGLGERRPDQLSGGQQQRVAVARALAGRPDLVLLDEPFSALDASLRVSVRDAVMAALRAEAASVLLVTHDQDEALSVADLVAVMLDGRIAQVGTPAEVYGRPRTVDVAGFLGEAVLLPARAADGVAHCALGRVPLDAPAPTAGAVTVLLRPEQLAVAPAGAGDGVAGRVESVSFHGHDALLALRLADGTPVLARSLSGWLPRPGDEVAVSVRGTAWPLVG
jgi:iron(III) transport system ATP-binding protein